MLLGLPVELRLRIAEYALEQHPGAGVPYVGRGLCEHKNDYRPSENLTLLLVCRRFSEDFSKIAFQRTRFFLWDHMSSIRLLRLPLDKVQNVRKLGYCLNSHEMRSWGSCFYNIEQLNLDELVLLCSHHWAVGHANFRNLVLFLRRLVHVKTIKFVSYQKAHGLGRAPYLSLIGTIMKEDHFQRYDAPGAPNVETTWWDWQLNAHDDTITLEAKDPRPVLAEEEYMLLMKPRVDALMVLAQEAAGL